MTVAARSFTPSTAALPESAIVPIAEFIADDTQAWDALANDASEPNAFLERWFFVPAVEHLSIPADLRMLAVRIDDMLIGLMPVARAHRYGRMQVAHLQNWLHYHCFLGTPLVRAGWEAAFWSAALSALDRDPATRGFLHVTALDGEGPLATALLAARSGAAIVHRSQRALLASSLGPTEYYETTVRAKKRKEIRRLQARLAELGTVAARHLTDPSELDAWIDTFLALEAAGWKGREGAALANDAGTAAFTRAALHGAQAAGRLDLLRLDLDGRAIAMLVNFRTPPGSFSFKIAFDEEYARFSPGVLVSLENLRSLADPAIAWMDSCAAPDHPMIDSLWGERRTLVRISVPLAGLRRRATFTGARGLERSAAWLRRTR